MNFSSLAHSLVAPKNPLYTLHDELRGKGQPVLDLVKGNVTEHGIAFSQEDLSAILSEAAEMARVYRPDSFGQVVAREAIANYYSGRIPISQILLTPGTSVSYWYCFKLLAEPGGEILTPQPSYPLFDYIAQLCGVTLKPYRLDESRGWMIDFAHLKSQITSRTRAIVLISPHNPTGMVASQEELRELAAIALKHQLPIISDEVFNEFLFEGETLPRPAFTQAPLVFTLNGFSKLFAMPGMKLGWIGVSGEPGFVSRSMAALEMISDTFLPVNEVVQFAAPRIFERGRSFVLEYKEWVGRSRSAALECLEGCDFTPPAGGFYVTLRLKQNEEAAAERLLRESYILTHPGYFYDIEPNHLVMTFIQEPDNVRRAFTAIAAVARG
jgi:aspartate/methionine/tyrosine aminotransferase